MGSDNASFGLLVLAAAAIAQVAGTKKITAFEAANEGCGGHVVKIGQFGYGECFLMDPLNEIRALRFDKSPAKESIGLTFYKDDACKEEKAHYSVPRNQETSLKEQSSGTAQKNTQCVRVAFSETDLFYMGTTGAAASTKPISFDQVAKAAAAALVASMSVQQLLHQF